MPLPVAIAFWPNADLRMTPPESAYSRMTQRTESRTTAVPVTMTLPNWSTAMSPAVSSPPDS